LRGLVTELAERGLKVDYRTVWNFLHSEKLSFKKKCRGWAAMRASTFAITDFNLWVSAFSAVAIGGARLLSSRTVQRRSPVLLFDDVVTRASCVALAPTPMIDSVSGRIEPKPLRSPQTHCVAAGAKMVQHNRVDERPTYGRDLVSSAGAAI
jgi:hypothetical protein